MRLRILSDLHIECFQEGRNLPVMPDFRIIEQPVGEVFTVLEIQRFHAEAMAWLEAALSEPCSVKFGRGHLMWLNDTQYCP